MCLDRSEMEFKNEERGKYKMKSFYERSIISCQIYKEMLDIPQGKLIVLSSNPSISARKLL